MVIKKTKQLINQYPSHTVFVSLIVMIMIGTCILALPACRKTSMSIIDLFFIATSLITVTGLTPVCLNDFTAVGQMVMLCLMQIGGLGLMTMSLMIMALFIDFGLYTQILAREILSIQSFKDSRRILFFILKFTFACECLGAIATFLTIHHDYSWQRALFLSIFHAVSSFCNVGISLFSHQATFYQTNPTMLCITSVLILLGSLGFVTWHEFFNILQRWKKTDHHKVSWHTQLVLKIFFITSLIGTVLFWLLERQNTMHHLTYIQSFFNLLLISMSTKSAGYICFDISMLEPATMLLLAIIALLGTAPSSTGGGIKTSAFAIFLAIIKATIKGRSHAEIQGRHIAKDQVYKAMAIISLSCSWIIIVTFCLLITEKSHPFLDIIFETVSAFSNNGISTGLTSKLTFSGKLFMIATMIVGRIGALTLIIGMKRQSDILDFSYPEERIILG